jgi:hypothetical protein
MKGEIELWVAVSPALLEERSRRFPEHIATSLLAGKGIRLFEQPLRHGDDWIRKLTKT